MLLKGTYVEIMVEVLDIKDRAENIPIDTKNTPLTMWVRGNLIEDSDIGMNGKIKTIIGRVIEGKVVEENPHYNHDFGTYIKEIDYIGIQAKELLFKNNYTVGEKKFE